MCLIYNVNIFLAGKGGQVRTAIERFEMFVFDRTGRTIFHSTDPNNGWDGRMPNGEMAPETAYVYRMYIKETYAEEYQMTGSVTLIR